MRGAGGSQSRARPNQTTRYMADYILSVLVNWLNSHGCGRQHTDVQIHARERQREGEADCVPTQNNSNYLMISEDVELNGIITSKTVEQRRHLVSCVSGYSPEENKTTARCS